MRGAFHEAIAEFNETAAMSRGVLFIPVSLGSVVSKRPYQFAVDENIRTSRHYIQVLDTAPNDGWGPSERNFERDYQLALSCCDDSSKPMTEVAVLLKTPAHPPANLAGAARTVHFAHAVEFRQQLLVLFSNWLQAICPVQSSATVS